MTSLMWVILIVAIIVIALAIIFGLRARTKRLQAKFGPEYDRVVQARGSTITAEKELEHRAKRVENLKIHALSDAESQQFAAEWKRTQELFVENPRQAVADADRLLHGAMKACGYPIGEEFEQRAKDLSVDHAGMLEHYRAGHDIAVNDARRPIATEDLRQAMNHYRAVFEDLIGQRINETTGARR